MAFAILVPVDHGNNEIRNVLLQSLASDPSPLEAKIYYNSTAHEVRFYNGTSWISVPGVGGGGSVTGVTGTAPIVSSGGNAPAISINAATGSTAGSLSAADFAKLAAATAAATSTTLALRDSSGRLAVATPSATGDAANKGYVDGLINGADWAESCVLVSTSNIAALSGVVTVIDGITATAGMRVLLTAQTTASQNGPWVVASGAWTRPVDYAAGATITPNRSYFIEQGTAKHDTGWTLSTDTAVIVDTTSTAWTQFTGLGEVTAGNGLTKTGDTLSVLANGSTITVGASGISVTNPPLRFSTNVGDGASVAIAVAHNLGTRDVHITVYRNSTPWDTVLTDAERTDTNNVMLRFATAPTSNQFRVVVTG